MKNIIVAHDNEFNKKVGDNSMLSFKDSNDLQDKLEKIEFNFDNYFEFKDKS